MTSTSRCSSAPFVRGILCSMVLAGLIGPATQPSFAGLFTLVDDNSSAHFDTGSQANNDSWIVDGVNQLHQQAFWFRIGQGDLVPEQSVHTLPIAGEFASNTNFTPGLDTLDVLYQGAGFQIETKYSLDGGVPGSGSSDLGEQISITNTSASPLDFHFYQYADFDLRATPGGDTVRFTNGNAVRQSQGPGEVSETVLSPEPSHREVAFFHDTLDKLNDASSTTLSGASGPLGPGNVTWANQWDFLLQPNTTFQISKDKRLSGAPVPEPATCSLLSLAAGLLLTGRRIRRAA
jgi:hypothetical protein